MKSLRNAIVFLPDGKNTAAFSKGARQSVLKDGSSFPRVDRIELEVQSGSALVYVTLENGKTLNYCGLPCMFVPE